MTYYLLEPCKTSAGFMSTLKSVAKLNLKDTALILREADFDVTDVGPLLVIRKDVELTLYRNGKMIAKTNSRREAERSVSEVYSLILPGTGGTL